MNRACGLESDARALVVQKMGRIRGAGAAECEQHAESDGLRGVGLLCGKFGGVSALRECSHDPVAQHRIAIRICLQCGKQGGHGVADLRFPERLRGKEPHARFRVAESGRRLAGPDRSLGHCVREHAPRLGTDFWILVENRLGGAADEQIRRLVGELSECPNRVQPRLPGSGGGSHGFKCGTRLHAPLCEFKLRREPHALVRVSEQFCKFLRCAFRHSFREQPLRFLHGRARIHDGIMHAVDAALAGFFPAIDPVEHAHAAARRELHVARIQVPQQLVSHLARRVVLQNRIVAGHAVHLVARALLLQFEMAHAAGEIGDEKIVAVFFRQPGARVVRDARGAVRDVRDGWEDGGVCLRHVEVPHALAVPCAELWQELPADAPAVVRALDDVNPARLVAAVGVVVAGEKVAHIVEREALRIAQAPRVKFERVAIRPAAEDRAAVRHVDHLTFLRRHVRAAVRDREIDAPVRPHLHAVHVVPAECDVHAEAGREFRLRSVGRDAPEVGRARIDGTAIRHSEHSCAEAGFE